MKKNITGIRSEECGKNFVTLHQYSEKLINSILSHYKCTKMHFKLKTWLHDYGDIWIQVTLKHNSWEHICSINS